MKRTRVSPTSLKIALIGTRGVPAQYGGFETCVEEVGRRLAARGHDVTVYCRRTESTLERVPTYLGMKLVWLPALRKRSLETLSHTGLSIAHLALRRTDVAIVFNAANSPWLPLIRLLRIPVATHMDGLEWKRAKWGPVGQKYYRMAESVAVRWSDGLIADAAGIQNYYRSEFNADTELIKYGAPIIKVNSSKKLEKLGLESKKYHLVVARFEPENHIDVIVEGYVRSQANYPLVVVGSAPYSDEYTRRVQGSGDARVQFLGSIWDQELLNELYANSLVYWHGHSVGGTNPSLLRAMGAAAATNAFDVDFNREVLIDTGRYFTTAGDVSKLAEEAEQDEAEVVERGMHSRDRATAYDWDSVADGYEDLGFNLYTRVLQRTGGRRRSQAPVVPQPAAQSEQDALRTQW